MPLCVLRSVRLELADVFIYLLRLADGLDVDLMRAAVDAKNVAGHTCS